MSVSVREANESAYMFKQSFGVYDHAFSWSLLQHSHIWDKNMVMCAKIKKMVLRPRQGNLMVVFREYISCSAKPRMRLTRDLTDKPNQNQDQIESESGEESKGDINIS